MGMFAQFSMIAYELGAADNEKGVSGLVGKFYAKKAIEKWLGTVSHIVY